MKFRDKFVLAALLSMLVAAVLMAQYPPDDHPLVKRYPGSDVQGGHATEREFDQFDLILGPIDKDQKPSKTQRLEGKIYSVTYGNPEKRSVFEIYRNYEQNLTAAGFQILYSCDGTQCGQRTACCPHPMFYDPSYLRRFLAAKLTRPEGDVYVSLAVQAQSMSSRGDTQIDVIEVKPMESVKLVDASALAGDISRAGHAAIYGIYFDTGKADLKPQSDAALKEVARLLQQNASLRLYVVGHTDNQGTLDMNIDLSRRRADAVVKELTTRYGVAAQRLKALGDGPSAPVASNDSEQGRAMNRRVELVKQ